MADDTEGLTGDEKIIKEAKERFRKCEDWESDSRALYLDDLKFADADPDNGWQWPEQIRLSRQIDQRPCLTINKVRQHNLHIINDAKQNKPGISIRPTGDQATKESAEVFEGIARYVERNSNAQDAYDMALTFAVKAGIGYFMVTTDYIGPDTFDQDFYIRPVNNPLNVYLDCDIKEPDGSDAGYGFEFDNMPKDKFDSEHPDYAEKYASTSTLGNNDGWYNKDYVRVAVYFRKSLTKDKLARYEDKQGAQTDVRRSVVGPDIFKELKDKYGAQARNVVDSKVEWFKIAGDDIVDRGECPSKYIPIVRVIGEETIIDGILDRKGHTRNLKDAQRMYNYNSSASVESGALQGKIPWLASMEATDGLETYYRTANRVNHSWMPYNGIDDKGNQIAPPQRIQPPQSAPLFMEGMATAQNEMMMASGQYQSLMGKDGNEVSGKAIGQRVRQSETSTFHFNDNLGKAIRLAGRIIVDGARKVYDTPRVMQILAEDGTEAKVFIDPQAKIAFEQQKMQQVGEQEAEVKKIFNPNVGQYDVEADVGPGYATKRQEAFNAFSQIAAQNSDLMKVIGDLLFKYADFPGADDISDRLRRMVPPAVLGDGPTPDMVALQKQNQTLTEMLSELTKEIAEMQLKLTGKDQQKTIDVYEAQTKRLTAASNAIPETGADPMLVGVIQQTLLQMMGLNLKDVVVASKPQLVDAAAGYDEAGGSGIPPGARQNGPTNFDQVEANPAMAQ